MRVFFLRDATRFPIACVASEKVEDLILYALSICNPKDKKVFDRRRARTIAEERMKLVLSSTVREKVTQFSGYVRAEGNIKRALMQELEADSTMPNQVRAAAEYWLANRPVVEGEYLP